MSSNTPMPISKWEEIKKDYIEGNYITLRDLANKWEISYNTLCDHVYRHRHGNKPWKADKDAIETEVKLHAVEVAKKRLATTYSKTSSMMDDILDRVKQGIEAGVFSVKELPEIYAKLGTALRNVHSTIRLESGQSTQNIAVADETNTKDSLKDALSTLRESGLIDNEDIIDIN